MAPEQQWCLYRDIGRGLGSPRILAGPKVGPTIRALFSSSFSEYMFVFRMFMFKSFTFCTNFEVTSKEEVLLYQYLTSSPRAVSSSGTLRVSKSGHFEGELSG